MGFIYDTGISDLQGRRHAFICPKTNGIRSKLDPIPPGEAPLAGLIVTDWRTILLRRRQKFRIWRFAIWPPGLL
jgi:hypothetical protein